MLRVANIELNIQGGPCNVAMLLLVSEHCRCKLCLGADQISRRLHNVESTWNIATIDWKTILPPTENLLVGDYQH